MRLRLASQPRPSAQLTLRRTLWAILQHNEGIDVAENATRNCDRPENSGLWTRKRRPRACVTSNVPRPKRFVYILKSLQNAATYYVGITSDFNVRLAAHNAGLSPHTAEHRPWRTLVVIEFDDEEPALKFEKYLKTGSGREFARRHFRQTVAPSRRRQ